MKMIYTKRLALRVMRFAFCLHRSLGFSVIDSFLNLKSINLID